MIFCGGDKYHITIFWCQDGDFYKHPVCVSGQAQWSKRLGWLGWLGWLGHGSSFENIWWDYMGSYELLNYYYGISILGYHRIRQNLDCLFSHNTTLAVKGWMLKWSNSNNFSSFVEGNPVLGQSRIDGSMRIRYDGDERNGQAGLGHVTGRNTAPISAFLLSPIYKSCFQV